MTTSVPPGVRRSRSAGSARVESRAARRSRRCAPPERAARSPARRSAARARRESPRRGRRSSRTACCRGAGRSRAPAAPPRGSSPNSLNTLVSVASSSSFSSVGRARVRVGAHAHVERRARTEGKPALASSTWCDEMPRSSRMPSKRSAGELGHVVDVRVVRLDRRRIVRPPRSRCSRRAASASAFGSRSTPMTCCDASLEQRTRVPAAAERAVEHACSRRETTR